MAPSKTSVSAHFRKSSTRLQQPNTSFVFPNESTVNSAIKAQALTARTNQPKLQSTADAALILPFRL